MLVLLAAAGSVQLHPCEGFEVQFRPPEGCPGVEHYNDWVLDVVAK